MMVAFSVYELLAVIYTFVEGGGARGGSTPLFVIFSPLVAKLSLWVFEVDKRSCVRFFSRQEERCIC